MEPTVNPFNSLFGNVWQLVAGVLAIIFIALGLYTLVISGERNVLQQEIKTKDAEIACDIKDVAFMKAWMARDKLDAIKKEADYNQTMAAKPKFKTQIQYVPTGNNCVDVNAIIDAARGNKNTEESQP